MYEFDFIRPLTGYMTIGFVTAKRPKNILYMFDTLNSLMTNADESDKTGIVILILIAETDEKWKTDIITRINKTYPYAVADGTIQIIQTFNWIYPKLNNLEHHYDGHSKLRVSWKAKQNIDFALLWLYAYKKNMSSFYLHLEDDVITVKGYIKIMRAFIEHQKRRWVCLEFSELGMIAKLYHISDLQSLSTIVTLFYEEQPADVTYLSFNSLMLQFGRIVHKPTLFQHMGLKSTLTEKLEKLKDSLFIGNFSKPLIGNNPPADVVTTMAGEGSSPQLAYGSSYGFFWSGRYPRQNEYFRVKFKSPQSVRRIVIVSGSIKYPKDKIENAALEVSQSLTCTNFRTVGYFQNGVFDYEFNLSSIHCFQIKLLSRHTSWILIQEVAVFL